MPCLKQCCCGCSLETGARFSAIYCLVVSIGCIAIGAWIITEANDVSGNSKLMNTMAQQVTDKTMTYKDFQNGVLAMGWICVVIGAILFLASALLLCGISSRNVAFIWPWLIYIIVEIIAQVIWVIYACLIQSNMPIGQGIGSLVPTIVLLYFFLVVYSFKQSITEEQFQESEEYPREIKHYSRSNQQVW